MRTNKIESDIDAFREIVRGAFSFNDVRIKLGYKPSGGIQKYLRIACVKHGISTAHFTGQLWSKGKTSVEDPRIDKAASRNRLPFNKIFCKNSIYKGNNQGMLKRLIAEGIKEYKCEECGLSEWRGKPLTLQVDHINGDKIDNRIVNLKVLCPNCHSQTSTFGNKKRACG